MSTEVKVPAVGESITSGIVSVWHKKSGDQVKAGDALFTLETDKVSTEITAEKDGVLQTRVAEGAEVKIGDVVAVIEEGSGSVAKPAVEPGVSKGDTKPVSTAARKSPDAMSPAVRRVAAEEKLDPEKISGSGKGGRVTKGDALAAAKNRETVPSRRQRATQLPVIARKKSRACNRRTNGSRAKRCRRSGARSRRNSSWRSTRPRSSQPSTNAT